MAESATLEWFPLQLPIIAAHWINGFDEGRVLLEQHTEALLGPPPAKHTARIMVTMPTEAANDPVLIEQLLANGMDCMRINCAHDDASAWKRMIEHLRHAEQSLGRRCRVLMDLAGPRLRTGPIESGIQVIKWSPRRNPLGKVVSPARTPRWPGRCWWGSAFRRCESRWRA